MREVYGPLKEGTKIDYNAWGEPTVAQGGSLEGRSILWNGYFYDSETDNYYLRNRYYLPTERSFITQDPRGVNLAGLWNNPFAPQIQLKDGFALQVYTSSDPINNRDDWGLFVVIAGLDKAMCGLGSYWEVFSGAKICEKVINTDGLTDDERQVVEADNPQHAFIWRKGKRGLGFAKGGVRLETSSDTGLKCYTIYKKKCCPYTDKQLMSKLAVAAWTNDATYSSWAYNCTFFAKETVESVPCLCTRYNPKDVTNLPYAMRFLYHNRSIIMDILK